MAVEILVATVHSSLLVCDTYLMTMNDTRDHYGNRGISMESSLIVITTETSFYLDIEITSLLGKRVLDNIGFTDEPPVLIVQRLTDLAMMICTSRVPASVVIRFSMF